MATDRLLKSTRAAPTFSVSDDASPHGSSGNARKCISSLNLGHPALSTRGGFFLLRRLGHVAQASHGSDLGPQGVHQARKQLRYRP